MKTTKTLNPTIEIEKQSFLARKVEGVSFVTQISMSVEELLSKVKPHPKQPDSRTRRAHTVAGKHVRGKHHVLHQFVNMAIYKGQYYLLDSHTRSEAWRNKYLTEPAQLLCNIFECETEEQFNAMFSIFDNRKAAETTSQDVEGSKKSAGYDLNKFFQKHITVSALKLIEYGKSTGLKSEEIEHMWERFLWEDALVTIKKIEEQGYPERKDFVNKFGVEMGGLYRQGVMAALLKTFREDETKAKKFWKKMFTCSEEFKPLISTLKDAGYGGTGNDLCYKNILATFAIFK